MDQHTERNQELDAAVAAARRPLERRAMPRVGLRMRVKTSPALRRLLPTSIAVRRAVARGEAKWEQSERARDYATRMMDAVVGGTEREAELTELARRYVMEDSVHSALFWQPWKKASMDRASRERLQRARAQGRGILISACHLGPIFLYMSAVSSQEHAVHIVSAPWFFEQASGDLWGRRLARWWHGLRKRNERLIYSVGAFEVVRVLLEEGDTVLSYFDMPGSRRTRFLGKPVMLSGSTATLAMQTGALVVPMRARRVGTGACADVAEPLDPRDFSSAEELHDALAAVHERRILELPEALEDPNRTGAWEGRATRVEWALPQRADARAPARGAAPDTGGLPV